MTQQAMANGAASGQTTEKRSGFGCLPCPCCREEGTVRLDLDDLSNCQCVSCEEEFSLDDVRQIIESWAPVLAWIDTAPKMRE